MKKPRDSSQQPPADEADVIVVGAGFAGLYMLYRLRELGLSTRVLEAGGDVGGTWYWNRYPGARCDVESVEYSYSFSAELQQEWTWSERYATQPEILRYLQHVADRFDLRRDITFNTRVVAATYDEAARRWVLKTDTGAQLSCRFFIAATGCLSVPNWPTIPGLKTFAGRLLHTALWPHTSVDFRDKRVGIIGTGSSACQSLPLIAEEASEVYVFQRTPNHCVPAENHPLDAEYVAEIKRRYPQLRKKWRSSFAGTNYPYDDRSALEVTARERELAYEARWKTGGTAFNLTFNDLLIDQAANDTASKFVADRIREIVKDPSTAECLIPAHPMATKRLCLVEGYYEAFNRANVHLVDLRRNPIEEVLPQGVRTQDGMFELDDLIVATGFDALTGALLGLNIRGRGGCSLRDEWANGPKTFLGLTMAGFPNLFAITAPGGPSVLSDVVASIEVHVEWITRCLRHMIELGHEEIDTESRAQDEWMAHVREVANGTLFAKAKSWYSGHNIEGKRGGFTIYIGGFNTYVRALEECATAGYSGFRFKAARAATER